MASYHTHAIIRSYLQKNGNKNVVRFETGVTEFEESSKELGIFELFGQG